MVIGGSGGAAGNGGKVDVTHTGDVSTAGDGSIGIFAQTVGGGGGTGKNASSGGTLGLFTGIWPNSFAFGGSGGAGGDGGAIDLILGDASSITTAGTGSHGVMAQSVGGGGGYGGMVKNRLLYKTYSFTAASEDAAVTGHGGNIVISMDGSGATRTDGQALIRTTGDYAHGIWAASLGGGGTSRIDTIFVRNGSLRPGGDGAGSVEVQAGDDGGGEVYTKGHLSHAVLALSVAGGGGESGSFFQGPVDVDSIFLTNGRSGIVGAGGGAVTVGNTLGSELTTRGVLAQAIVAASVGNSGGAIGLVMDNLVDTHGMILTNGASGQAAGTGG